MNFRIGFWLQRSYRAAAFNLNGRGSGLGCFNPVVKIRLTAAEILRDFSAAEGGGSLCLLCWYFLIYWVFILSMLWLVFLYSVKSMLLITPFLSAVIDSVAINSVAV
ncbi:hypothetical protein [Serratia sp. Nf2]|uniref:hypothetical protein n=1 Tax=Serratia sp. Nf2 TaxID=2116540 RepID=UPI0011B228D0|nr:hypothetical protein [Serratia sp. Nf2]